MDTAITSQELMAAHKNLKSGFFQARSGTQEDFVGQRELMQGQLAHTYVWAFRRLCVRASGLKALCGPVP